MKLPLTDLIIFLIYMAGILLFGFSFFFRNRNSDQYTRGGGNIPSWAVAMMVYCPLPLYTGHVNLCHLRQQHKLSGTTR